MVELIAVMVVMGVLAAFAVPKLQGMLSVRDDTWRDEVVSGLRLAHKTALSHRRLVCVALSNTQLTVTIASANPATSCDVALGGLGSGTAFATSDNSASTTTVSPGGTIYFQPDGRVTTDGAGASTSGRTIAISGVSANVSIVGETGRVE